MDYIARKFNRAHWDWPIEPWMDENDIPADATKQCLMSCLRTQKNTLSLWECEREPGSVAEVVLAIASSWDRLDSLDIVMFHKDEIASLRLAARASKGDTRARYLANRHLDLVELTLDRLCRVAKAMASKVRLDQDCRSFTKAEVTRILDQAIRDKRVHLAHLKRDVRAEIEPLLGRH